MHTQTTLFRLMSALAVGGLLVAPALPGAAWAQAEANPNATGGDPPSRVGRLAQTNGTVSFHAGDETDWQAATPNYPVTSGNSFWTEPSSSADIEIGATRIALNQSTEFDIDTLDDQTLSASEPQGTVYVGSTAMGPNESYQIQTPRGTVTINQPGRYAINAGDTDNPTTVTVESGSAQVQGPGVSVTVAAQQTAVFTGTDTFQANVGPGQPDPQMDALLAPAAPAPLAGAAPAPAAPAAPPPPVVAEMTGGADLSTTGSWQPTPQYGTVWYPPVQSGWVPYREGHWGYVAPWGWTWIDNASWGFAPFHYGRWVQVGPRWGWVPVTPGVTVAVGAPPVYAPALVAFAGFAAGVAVGLAVGGGPSVGWVPLGPREAYYPPYRVSNNYVRNVNVTNVSNVTTINNNNTTINNYANARAATVVPASAMANSQPIATVARPIAPQQLAAARPVTQVPVRPTANTVGVTPAVARQLNIPRPAPGATPARPAAPGPAVQPRPAASAPAAAKPGATTPVAAKPPLPTLRPHAATTPANAPAVGQQPRPGAPGAPVAGQPPRPGAPAVGQTAPAAPGAIQSPRPGAPATPTPGAATPPAPGAAQPARPAAPGPTATPPPPAASATPQAKPAAPALRPATPPAAGTTTPAARPPGAAAPGPAITPRPGTPVPGAAARPPTPTTPAPARPPAPTVQHPAPQTQHAPPPKPATPAPQTMRAPPPAPHPPAVAQRAPAPAPHPAPAPAAHPAAKQCPPGKTTC